MKKKLSINLLKNVTSVCVKSDAKRNNKRSKSFLLFAFLFASPEKSFAMFDGKFETQANKAQDAQTFSDAASTAGLTATEERVSERRAASQVGGNLGAEFRLEHFCFEDHMQPEVAPGDFLSHLVTPIASPVPSVTDHSSFVSTHEVAMMNESGDEADEDVDGANSSFYQKFVNDLITHDITNLDVLRYSIFALHSMSNYDFARFMYLRYEAVRDINGEPDAGYDRLDIEPSLLPPIILLGVITRMVDGYNDLRNKKFLLIDEDTFPAVQANGFKPLVSHHHDTIQSEAWKALKGMNKPLSDKLTQLITPEVYDEVREFIYSSRMNDATRKTCHNFLVQKAFSELSSHLHDVNFDANAIMQKLWDENNPANPNDAKLGANVRARIQGFYDIRSQFQGFWRAFAKPGFNISQTFEQLDYLDLIQDLIDQHQSENVQGILDAQLSRPHAALDHLRAQTPHDEISLIREQNVSDDAVRVEEQLSQVIFLLTKEEAEQNAAQRYDHDTSF